MNKTNLEMFKMSKAQMNKVNGGMRCAITDREFGGTIFMDFEVADGISTHDAIMTVASEFGPGFTIVC